MEDVSTVLMHIDVFNVFTIDVAAKLRTLVYDQTTLALLMSEICECGTKKAAASYEIIVGRDKKKIRVLVIKSP